MIHDLNGQLREPFDIGNMFGQYEQIPRQEHIIGDGGKCDLHARLIETFESAKRHGIYIILSQRYFLHTYWYHRPGDLLCDEMFAIPVEERFSAFTKFWHYILQELEQRGLDQQIAFVEVFNEVDEHPYLCGAREWGANVHVSPDETAFFKKQHEEAIQTLQKAHPQILFAFDACTGSRARASMPANAQVYNFHAYFLWDIYNEAFRAHPEWFSGRIKSADVAAARKDRRPAAKDWYARVAQANDLDPAYLPDVERTLENLLKEKAGHYLAQAEKHLNAAVTNSEGRMPIVCGEGVSYIISKKILWEEHSQRYWELVKQVIGKYKEAGVWGTVIRTCSGPEDPCWHLCQDKLLELNRYFLQD